MTVSRAATNVLPQPDQRRKHQKNQVKKTKVFVLPKEAEKNKCVNFHNKFFSGGFWDENWSKNIG